LPSVRPCSGHATREAFVRTRVRGFPDWDYVPPDETCPFEYKASDWGYLPDGRLVALDCSAPALSDPSELENEKREILRNR
jgi:hypothetical protein